MKKSIIALMGLFTLIACSEDTYQEADKMNETGTVENSSGGMQTNSFDTSLPGSSIPGLPSTAFYQSPYLYFVPGSPDGTPGYTGSVEYHFINNTTNTIVITPSVGFYVWGTTIRSLFCKLLSWNRKLS